jgi:hypothetical protein
LPKSMPNRISTHTPRVNLEWRRAGEGLPGCIEVMGCLNNFHDFIWINVLMTWRGRLVMNGATLSAFSSTAYTSLVSKPTAALAAMT